MSINTSIEIAINNYKNSLKTSFNLECIFFDMDGVLFNSMPYHAQSWINAFAEYGLNLPEHEPYMNEGSTALYTIEKMFRKYHKREVSLEFAEEIKKRKHALMTEMPMSEVLQPMPQLVEMVKQQNIERWVVTGSAQKGLFGRLSSVFDGNFERDKMITALDVLNGKPNPEPYLKAIEKSGYDNSRAIVIENAPLGVQSAKAAGLFTVAINTGPLEPQSLSESGADIVLDSCDELLALWPQLHALLSK